eukprot:TRINITY_DN7507_c0_g1_i1.p1 TRINITY_DN7507_c0_g1~~TRINITY_DN7507_c0_g1_i1.p1  ORF type:complete len:117 (+),score=51.47 TRINITY_DN7507_c0_g1_i1:31-381(+)
MVDRRQRQMGIRDSLGGGGVELAELIESDGVDGMGDRLVEARADPGGLDGVAALGDGGCLGHNGEGGEGKSELHVAWTQVPVLCVDTCLLYTSDAADDLLCVDLGGRRIIKKKNYV